MTLIGIGGKKRAGKDAVAEVLKNRFGFTVLGMSDALHEAILTLDPWINVAHADELTLSDGSRFGAQIIRYSHLAQLVSYDEMKKSPEVRRLLQVFGTEVGRTLLGENVWVDVMTRKIQALQIDYAIENPGKLSSDARIAVTGIRFENELDMIIDLKGWSTYVKRPSLASEVDTHASELGLIATDFDHILVNGGSMSDLEATVIEHMFELYSILPNAPRQLASAA